MKNAMPLRKTLGKTSRFLQRISSAHAAARKGMSDSRMYRKYPNGKMPTSSKTGANYNRTMTVSPARTIRHRSK